ncbi:MAG: Peptidase, M20/M25/M40 family [Parcubacteria bacterium 33_209]|nr:MAG: Peptidase, M20/M25/M40 family [Parcubacteria bacterium 33_209]
MTPEQILSDLIKINTVNPPGNETSAAVYLKQIFDDAGISNEIIESEKGRGNFIAHLGEGSKRLLFLSHTDVVPAGADWNDNPFSGSIYDNTVHGRGAMDCKGLAAAQASAMLNLARNKTPLNGTLIFAATADEEKGGDFGVKMLLDQHPDKLRCDFAINEGAEEPVQLGSKTIFFIQVGEKGTAWSRLVTRGKACHGSIPTIGENALVKMVCSIKDLSGYKPEIILIPEVKHLLTELSKIKGFGATVSPENADELINSLGDKSLSETLRSMTRMTVSPNVISGGEKINIVPDLCQAEVDIRVLPGQDLEYVLDELRKFVSREIEIEVFNYHEPTFSTSDTDYYRLIEKATGEVAGSGVICLPYISPGATDSRYLRLAGISAYGIGHMASGYDQSVKETVHGKNERIDIPSLKLRTDFLIALAREYLA